MKWLCFWTPTARRITDGNSLSAVVLQCFARSIVRKVATLYCFSFTVCISFTVL